MMRKIASFVILAFVSVLTPAWSAAETINIPVQALAVIYPPHNDSDLDHGLRLLIKFDLPESLSTSRILFSEACLPLPLIQFSDTTFSFGIFALTASWGENEVDWNFPWVDPGGDIDSSESFCRFFTIGDDSLVLDLTELTRNWLQEGRQNYGCLITTNFTHRRGLRFNIDNILPVIRSSLFLRIKFDNLPIGY
jgi:hypothetical protein